MNTFTLVIPTRNRPALLRRVLRYYDENDALFPIIVADSSDATIRIENQNHVESLTRAQLGYMPFETSIDFFDKIQTALASVNTPYVGFCADDDFLSVHAPVRAATFLDAHPDYTAVHGRAVAIRLAPFVITASSQRAARNENVIRRLEEYYDLPTANFYAIHRTANFIQILTRLAKSRTDNTRFEELAVSSLEVINGKIKALNALHLVRQTSVHRGDSSSRETGGWTSVVKSPTFSANKEIFLRLLADALIELGTPAAEAMQLVTLLFSRYLDRATGKAPDNRLSRTERMLAAALRPSAPTTWRRLVQGAIGTLLTMSPAVRQMRREFRPIEEILRRYPDGISI